VPKSTNQSGHITTPGRYGAENQRESERNDTMDNGGPSSRHTYIHPHTGTHKQCLNDHFHSHDPGVPTNTQQFRQQKLRCSRTACMEQFPILLVSGLQLQTV